MGLKLSESQQGWFVETIDILKGQIVSESPSFYFIFSEETAAEFQWGTADYTHIITRLFLVPLGFYLHGQWALTKYIYMYMLKHTYAKMEGRRLDSALF